MSDGGGALAFSVVGLVPSIFTLHLPNLATVRAEADDAGHYAASLRSAALTASIAVGAIAATTGSPEVLIAGGVTIVALTALYTHARGIPPWGVGVPGVSSAAYEV